MQNPDLKRSSGMETDIDRKRAVDLNGSSERDGEREHVCRQRRSISWVDKIYDIIDERIGNAMKRLSE